MEPAAEWKESLNTTKKSVYQHINTPVSVGSGHRDLPHKAAGRVFGWSLISPPGDTQLQNHSHCYASATGDFGVETGLPRFETPDGPEKLLPDWMLNARLTEDLDIDVDSDATAGAGDDRPDCVEGHVAPEPPMSPCLAACDSKHWYKDDNESDIDGRSLASIPDEIDDGASLPSIPEDVDDGASVKSSSPEDPLLGNPDVGAETSEPFATPVETEPLPSRCWPPTSTGYFLPLLMGLALPIAGMQHVSHNCQMFAMSSTTSKCFCL